TVLAATVALGIFLAIDPVHASTITAASPLVDNVQTTSYWGHLLNIVPSNLIQPFSENNVMGVLVLAFIISLGMFAIPTKERQVLHSFFGAIYSVFMKITGFIVKLIPIALWAFIALFVREVQQGLNVTSIGYYLAAVV